MKGRLVRIPVLAAVQLSGIGGRVTSSGETGDEGRVRSSWSIRNMMWPAVVALVISL
jgi:hypothetical protein